MEENEKNEEINELPEPSPRVRRKRVRRQQENIDLQVEEAPEETSSGSDSLASRVIGALGLDTSKTPARETNAKLTLKQRAFVDSMSPVAAGIFVLAASWAWRRVGQEYQALAPDMEVATQITQPLIRIWARLAKADGAINPNIVDLAQCTLALVGYVDASWALYQKMREQEHVRLNEEEIRSDTRRAGRVSQQQNSSYVPPDTRTDDSDEPQGSFQERHERQRTALSRLSQMDYEHRARRSSAA